MDSEHQELAELDTSFKLKPRSKFHKLSIPQAEADAALSASDQSGIVVFPCGAGKTALFVRAAMRNYNVLVLSYESQGVLQVADVVLEETDVGKDLLCCYTAEKRTEPNRLSCFMVATYSMFAGSTQKQSKHTRLVSEFVFTRRSGTSWCATSASTPPPTPFAKSSSCDPLPNASRLHRHPLPLSTRSQHGGAHP